MKFTSVERAILRIAQKDLPDSATPYADMAQTVAGATGESVSEADVLALLTRLTDSGAIRRFGASIKHQRTGWNHNLMVAWMVDSLEEADTAGDIAAKHPRISHCYYRPSPGAQWPYSLYTMIHGRTAQECRDVIHDLQSTTSLRAHAVLESLQELKKTSMVYFPDEIL